VSDIYDVVIVGAGPGGSATAYYLARQGLAVLLLDKAEFPRDKTCGDGLTPRALAVLDDMGLLDKLSQVGCRINGMEIYAPNGRSIGAPIPISAGRPAYMLVVPRLTLDNILCEHAQAAGAVFQAGIRVTDVRANGAEGVVVEGELNGHKTQYTGRAAVIATGANPRLIMRMGAISEAPATMVAARAYYENLDVMNDRIQLRFDGVPMPGYAWVFPTATRTANVGAGFCARGRRRKLPSPQEAMAQFLQHSHLKDTLARARRISPVKGYPLRVDFTTAPTFCGRVLFVGEAAGLVNPLSGEGVDYALESGQVAAGRLASMFKSGDFSPAQFEAYDHELREHFQALFRFCARVRDLFFNRPALDILVWLASRRMDLRLLLIRIVLGNQTVPQRLSYGKMLRVLLHTSHEQ
jgi:menaquinone-9 beta-reductase